MEPPRTRTEIIAELFDLHADAVYRFARYSLPPEIDARDAVQEVFLRAFRSWSDFEGRSDPKTWLLRIARNYVYDVLRAKRRQREREVAGIDPDSHVDLGSILELEDAVARLQPDYQQVLNLRWIQDLSVADTAQVLGWTEGKVRLTFHRARKKLKELLQDVPPEYTVNEPKGGEAHHEQRRK